MHDMCMQRKEIEIEEMEKRSRGLGWISTFLLILMVILPPFFPTCTSGRTILGMTGDQYKKTSQADLKKEVESGRGYGHNGLEEDSERQVPTGPDPLHHNSNTYP